MIRHSSKPAILAAALGTFIGLVYGIVCLRGGHYSPAESAVMLLVPALVAAFLTWWAWLFWGALRGDALIRRVAPLALVGLALFIFLMEVPAIRHTRRFQADGASTRGVVTGTYPNDHNRIGYRYAVGPLTYEGGDMASGSASSYKVGDSITVYFFRSEPSISTARYPSKTVGSLAAFALLGALWMVSGAANYHYYIRRRKEPPTIHLRRVG